MPATALVDVVFFTEPSQADKARHRTREGRGVPLKISVKISTSGEQKYGETKSTQI
jgi:hypothetical protein